MYASLTLPKFHLHQYPLHHQYVSLDMQLAYAHARCQSAPLHLKPCVSSAFWARAQA